MTQQGRCTCGAVHYRLGADPIVVHCCHCSWCQHDSGTAFALNAVIETDQIELLQGQPERVETPSASGRGQMVLRCAACWVALWSHYAGAGERAAFVRVGTLDNPGAAPPDVHIFTSSKQPWVVIPDGAEAYATFYPSDDVERIYGATGIARWRALTG